MALVLGGDELSGGQGWRQEGSHAGAAGSWGAVAGSRDHLEGRLGHLARGAVYGGRSQGQAGAAGIWSGGYLRWSPAASGSTRRGSVFKAEGLAIRAGKGQRDRRGPRRELGALSLCREQS